MTYTLRTAAGILVAKLPKSLAFQMMENLSGGVSLKHFVSGGSKTCYVFSGDGSMVIHGITIYVFPGYYLSKDLV